MNLRTDPALDPALRQLAARHPMYTTPQGKLDVSRMVSDRMRDILVREGLWPDPASVDLGQHIDDVLDLSVRVSNALAAAGVATLRDLTGMTEMEVRNLKNMGRRRAAEVLDQLEAFGLHFARERE